MSELFRDSRGRFVKVGNGSKDSVYDSGTLVRDLHGRFVKKENVESKKVYIDERVRSDGEDVYSAKVKGTFWDIRIAEGYSPGLVKDLKEFEGKGLRLKRYKDTERKKDRMWSSLVVEDSLDVPDFPKVVTESWFVDEEGWTWYEKWLEFEGHKPQFPLRIKALEKSKEDKVRNKKEKEEDLKDLKRLKENKMTLLQAKRLRKMKRKK